MVAVSQISLGISEPNPLPTTKIRLLSEPMGAAGSEPPRDSLGKSAITSDNGTNSGTLGDESTSNRQSADSDLADVVSAWPHLAPEVKAGIMAMVKAAKG
jgi:hypothetical protein